MLEKMSQRPEEPSHRITTFAIRAEKQVILVKSTHIYQFVSLFFKFSIVILWTFFWQKQRYFQSSISNKQPGSVGRVFVDDAILISKLQRNTPLHHERLIPQEDANRKSCLFAVSLCLTPTVMVALRNGKIKRYSSENMIELIWKWRFSAGTERVCVCAFNPWKGHIDWAHNNCSGLNKEASICS